VWTKERRETAWCKRGGGSGGGSRYPFKQV
jgi:hypothetical protein